MANYIKPTFTLTANKNSVATNKGPLSVAISLAATDSLSVDDVRSSVYAVPDTSGSTVVGTLLFDGSAQPDVGSGVAGTNGGFIFMRNVSADSTTNFIYIGVQKAGSAVDLDDDAQDERFCTLKVGEFMFFPFDYTMDIYVDANASGQLLEYWFFNRA